VNEYAGVCACRKPRTGLITTAAAELGVEPRDLWMVGDTWMDAAAGREAGCRTIMLGPDAVSARHLPPDRRPDHAVRDLDEAAAIIVASRPAVRVEHHRAADTAQTAGRASA
jgi:phosphoglycolate phosphatase-like HAD superfamily hydrolase